VLARVNAPGANFFGMDLGGDDLSGANVSGATLNVSLAKAELAGIVLMRATIEVPGADAPCARLVGLDLSKVTFFAQGNAPLTNTKFQGANLAGATFNGVHLSGAMFTGADTTGTSFFSATCPDGQPSDSSQPGGAASRL
jgi:hypothetical protein